jgi:hypothetical protein
MIKAVVLDDESLHIPDLSEAKEKDWITCAVSIPNLFGHRNHASRAFAKVLRDKHLQRAKPAAKWEAWKAEISERWDALQVLEESQNREAELRGLMPQATVEQSAMDEVEAHADAVTEDTDEIPF